MTTEYGVFNDEGCLEAQSYSPEEAEERRQAYIAEGEDPEDVWVKEICPDHEGYAKDVCEECFAEDNHLVDPHTWLRRTY
jgi:hypothetical protein